MTDGETTELIWWYVTMTILFYDGIVTILWAGIVLGN
jgi:hypothetical protein